MKIQDLECGDLLLSRDSSDMSQAIQESTGKYSHIAIYLESQVYHATKENGVIRQKLSDFLTDYGDAVFVYRYPRIDCQQTLANAKKHLGKPYNVSFRPGTESFYCSQYIAAILPIFGTIPMRFGDSSQEISPFWKSYYAKLGVPVPVGQPGSNPSQLAKSPHLRFLGRLDIAPVDRC